MKNFQLSTFNFQLNKGFTLIELLMVIGLLSVLIGGLLILIDPATQQAKARNARRKSDLAQIQRALEQYYQDNNKYPDNDPPGKIVGSSGAITWGTAWNPYMNIVPKDPGGLTPSDYVYQVVISSQSYRLYATLEKASSDKQACNTAGTRCPNAPSSAVGPCPGPNTCNYGVTSPDVAP